jgi:integrase
MPYVLIPPRVRGNRYWVARGSAGGRRIEISTKAGNKADADRYARQFFARADAVSQTGRRAEATFSNALRIYREGKSVSAAEAWRLSRLERVIGSVRLMHLTSPIIDRVARDFYPLEHQAASRNRNVRTPIASVMHYAAEAGWIEYRKNKNEKEIVPLMPAPSEDEIARLIGAAEPELRRLLIWIFAHGQRISHALALEWSRVNLARAEFSFLDTKRKVWRTVPIHAQALIVLTEVPATKRKGQVFKWRSRWGVYRQLDRLTKETGIRFRPHAARRAFARKLERAGVPTLSTSEAGGWQDVRSVKRYVGTDPDRLRATIDRNELPIGPLAESMACSDRGQNIRHAHI